MEFGGWVCSGGLFSKPSKGEKRGLRVAQFKAKFTLVRWLAHRGVRLRD